MLDWRVPGYRTVRELRPLGPSDRSVLAVHEASGLPTTVRYHAPEPTEVADARRAHVRTLADVRCPHIAALYEYVEGEQVGAVTVRAYVDGASVRRVLSAARLPPASALVVLRAGLLGLRAAYDQGLTHGAYNPENLLVDSDGSVRLADFHALHPHPATRDDFAPHRSEAREATGAPPGWVVPDVQAALDVFLECLTGRRTARSGKLPRRLRILTEPGAAGDGQALLDAVEKVGRAGWGQDWRTRGERDLARLVTKVSKRRQA